MCLCVCACVCVFVYLLLWSFMCLYACVTLTINYLSPTDVHIYSCVFSCCLDGYQHSSNSTAHSPHTRTLYEISVHLHHTWCVCIADSACACKYTQVCSYDCKNLSTASVWGHTRACYYVWLAVTIKQPSFSSLHFITWSLISHIYMSM